MKDLLKTLKKEISKDKSVVSLQRKLLEAYLNNYKLQINHAIEKNQR